MIELFTDKPELYNDWRFVWNGPWSREILLSAAILLLFILFLNWRSLLGMSSRFQRWSLLALRTGAAIALWMLLAEPAIELRNVQKTRNFLPVFVDTSASMKIKDRRDGLSRIELVNRFFHNHRELFKSLEEDNRLKWFHFDADVYPLAGLPEKFDAPGDRTDLFKIIPLLQKEFSHRPLSAVLLLTDGIDTFAGSSKNGALISPKGKRSGSPLRIAPRLAHLIAGAKEFGVPFYVVAPPTNDDFLDISIAEIYGDSFAFLHNTATIEVNVSGLGFSDRKVPVSLYREGRLIKTKVIKFSKDREKVSINFSFKPRKAGQFVYSVKVPVQPGEAITENNQKSFILKIIRDRIRVLQLTGRPSWDVRFLRRLLKKNASVDLVSFFILRTVYNIQPVSTREIALIPFPSYELFNKSIFTFDLAIFQNFNYGPYLPAYYLRNIERFVRRGGSLIMIGGDLSFGAGGYLNTPIEKLLPVKLNVGQIDPTPFRPRLTRAGRFHPITKLTADPIANLQLWNQFPPVNGTNLIGDPKKHATVLLEHPTIKTESGRPLPILTVGRYHKGRVMALTIDESWRWNFIFVGKGGNPGPYYRFWNNAIRWLIRDPELERIQITSFKSSYRMGQNALFRIRVLSRDYRPMKKGSVKITIVPALKKDSIIYKAEKKLDEKGLVHLNIKLSKPGLYRIRASSQIDPYLRVSGEALFEVRGFLNEYQNVTPNERFFTALAKATGGKVFRLDEKLSKLKLRPPTVVKVNRSHTVLIWNNSIIFIVIFLLFAMEWFFRRNWGMP